jgi:uncharacterized protein
VLAPVWRLYARAIERVGPTATLLEWDDNIPSFNDVHSEALKAMQFVQCPEGSDIHEVLAEEDAREVVHP